MKAMILAAGFGERMRPLTEHTPKPLLPVAGMPLIEFHLRGLAAAGFRQLVINTSHLGQQIVDYCGDGARWEVEITYSREDSPLETAGGIREALHLLGEAPFAVVNGDVWCEFPFARLREYRLASWETAHLVMVDSPPQHPLGDFTLDDSARLRSREGDSAGYTYAGIALFSPEFFAGIPRGRLALRPLLDAAIEGGSLGGEYFAGAWEDVGTPERLAALDARLRSAQSGG
ncbi:N-acetylmuramate alpha-1-phosphate uridylyltransferase MurU [Haliea sp. E17]|uniref:N-acetylmuramate alpha-1-phosphate uridylyltransferase MurU n=1 Tax=Haliea sp. E17 TaxID=3401576 RepID=UPI003AAAC4F2